MFGLKVDHLVMAGLAMTLLTGALGLAGFQLPEVKAQIRKYRAPLIAVAALGFVGLLYVQARTGRDLQEHLACFVFGCAEATAVAGAGPIPAITVDDGRAACERKLKADYTCDAFIEYAARSPNLLMSSDPRHLTLDEPIEFAVAVAQSKLIMGTGGDRCRVYEDSIAEACRTLANVAGSDLGAR